MSVKTISYSESANQGRGGWTSFWSFEPDWMSRLNNRLFSVKNGQLYLHNDPSVARNTFYGTQYESVLVFNLNQSPSDRKRFRTLEIEGSTALTIELETDYDQGYINAADFENKEGVYYAYVRISNGTVDTSLLSAQGVGEVATVAGNTLNFDFALDTVIGIGDVVLNASEQVVGTVVSYTANSITLNAVTNATAGTFVLCAKPQSVENQSLLGYYMQVTARFTSNVAEEIYAINSQVSKSHQ